MKISILIKISKYLDFGQNFRILPILMKIVEKSRFWSNFRKISIDVKLSKNPDFGQNFRKIPILVIIFEKSRFCLNFLKINLCQTSENSGLW